MESRILPSCKNPLSRFLILASVYIFHVSIIFLSGITTHFYSFLLFQTMSIFTLSGTMPFSRPAELTAVSPLRSSILWMADHVWQVNPLPVSNSPLTPVGCGREPEGKSGKKSFWIKIKIIIRETSDVVQALFTNTWSKALVCYQHCVHHKFKTQQHIGCFKEKW